MASEHSCEALINAAVAKMEKVLNDANEIPRNFGIKKLFLYVHPRQKMRKLFLCVCMRKTFACSSGSKFTHLKTL